MIVIKLHYESGDEFIVGAFPTMERADAWIAEEKTRPYWNESTIIEKIEEIPPPSPLEGQEI